MMFSEETVTNFTYINNPQRLDGNLNPGESEKSSAKIRHVERPGDPGIHGMESDGNGNTSTRNPENGNLLYGIEDIPPLPVLVCLAVQLALQQIPSFASISLVIAEAVCGDSVVTSKLLSTMIFLVGFATLLQTTIGIRLPCFQGPSLVYVTVILSRAQLPDWQCTGGIGNDTLDINITDVSTMRLQEAAGSLMAASGIHVLLALTGVVGLLTRFIGPATIVPAVFLLCLDLANVFRGFAQIHWGVTVFTSMVVLLFSTYLGHLGIPIPRWTRKRGWHIIRPKLFRQFYMLFGIAAGWLLCFILTVSGRLSSDPEVPEFETRTDRIAKSVDEAEWLIFPHPGQFGRPRFDIGLFFGYLVTVLVSVFDSVAQYYTTSKICNVSNPPPHAINRGLVVEGVCSLLSGAYGAAHATRSYLGIIGNMALTGVTSRRVFQLCGLLMMIIAFIGKFTAFFLTIPKPVMAGFTTVGITTLLGVILSNLKDINLEKPRNVVAVGFPIFFGYMLTKWVSANPTSIDVGIPELNQLFRSILGNSIFVAGCLGCFLDNTLPGKRDVKTEDISEGQASYDPAYEFPYTSGFLRRQTWTRYVPILPGFVGGKTVKDKK